MKGNGWLGRLITATLMTIVTSIGAWVVTSQNSRISALENSKADIAMEVTAIKWDLRGAREDICGLKSDIADLREELTKRRVYRRPCP